MGIFDKLTEKANAAIQMKDELLAQKNAFSEAKSDKKKELKRELLSSSLGSENCQFEFEGEMTHPFYRSGVGDSRITMDGLSVSPALCWVTETRLLVAYKNTHMHFTGGDPLNIIPSLGDIGRRMTENLNIYIANLDDIHDVKIFDHTLPRSTSGREVGLLITTLNNSYQFASTNPEPNVVLSKLNQPKQAIKVTIENSVVDVPEQLKKFAELRDQGIITDEEFLEQKKKLLS
jgi:hypothetical protein